MISKSRFFPWHKLLFLFLRPLFRRSRLIRRGFISLEFRYVHGQTSLGCFGGYHLDVNYIFAAKKKSSSIPASASSSSNKGTDKTASSSAATTTTAPAATTSSSGTANVRKHPTPQSGSAAAAAEPSQPSNEQPPQKYIRHKRQQQKAGATSGQQVWSITQSIFCSFTNYRLLHRILSIVKTSKTRFYKLPAARHFERKQ